MKNKFIAFVCLLVLSQGCKVSLISNYDAAIATQIENTLKMVDQFYLTMKETTAEANDGRAYQHFVNQYIAIEIELQSLVDKNKVRPLNKNSTAIAENVLEQFIKYKDQHKADNTIKDANIILNRMYMHDQLVRLQMGESFKPRE